MSNINFVFFHTGDITYPQLLVKTINKFNPGSRIYFLTGEENDSIDGVYKTIRFSFDKNNLMEARLKGFESLQLMEPAIYIDTDVLVVKKIPIELFQDHDIFLCSRSFGKNTLFNPKHLEKYNIEEYKNKTKGEVYPFIACFTYCKNFLFWKDCLSILNKLDKKFHFWYGDQECLRIINNLNTYDIGYLEESLVCTLPEFSKPGDNCYSVHFR